MNQRYQAFTAWRFYLVVSMIVLSVTGLVWRVFDLAILEQPFLRHQGDQRVLRLVNTPAFRGMIVDRHGFPLAISTIVYSVWINPKEFLPTKEALVLLSQETHLSLQDILSQAKPDQKKKQTFIYLKRGLSPEVAYQIKALHIPGLYLEEGSRRYYPEGEVTAHVIGFTNVDDQGQEGLELTYNGWLQGQPGKKWVIKDRLGQIISDVQRVQAEKPGRPVRLSVDRRIQYLAYRELMRGVLQNHAHAGSAIVLDAKTGEILAMVNQPSFNPNQRPSDDSDRLRNRAITDTFEPGSTIKAFSVASALDSGYYKPDTVINTSPGWIRVGRNIIKDEKNNGLLTITQILQISSNVGITRMILSLPPDQLWNVLHRAGFGEVTGIGFPGEQSGSLVQHHPWGASTLATLAYGYGISVTALQLARAYTIFANDGIKIPMSLLRVDQPVSGERVMDAKIARQMLLLLESVLEKGGTGEAARVPGYRVAGKTGTAFMMGDNGYQKHHYTASFVGIAPLTNPRLVVAVVIHDPQGKNYLGGFVAGPVFEKIMEGTLRILDIPPDEA